jgi:type I restriction enzyme S subunit
MNHGEHSGWKTTTVGDLAEVKGGKRLPAGFKLQVQPTSFPYIRVTDMFNGGVKESEIRYVPEDAAQAIKNYRIRSDDIFISVAGTLGIVGRVSERLDGANLTENADRLTSIKCDIDYLMHYLLSEPMQKEIDSIRTVGAQPKLALGRIKSFAVSLPTSTVEQATISRALGEVGSLITSLEEMIAKKQAIKQGMMQQLLTGKTRIPGFTSSWSLTTVGSVGKLAKGRGVKRDDVQSSGVPCIRYGELYTTFHDYTSSTVSFVDEEVAATALPIKAGDLLFAGSGETKADIGICVAYVGEAPAVAGGDIIVLRAESVNAVYLASLLNTPELAAKKASSGQGDAVVHINAKAIATLEINLPEKAEQDAIAQVIMDADLEISGLKRQLVSMRLIKQGMMQELLTGRTRLLPAGESE